MFRRGRQVFQVGQAPSGPTVIRPLPLITLVSSMGFPSDKLAFTNAHHLAMYYGIQYLTVWRNNKRIFTQLKNNQLSISKVDDVNKDTPTKVAVARRRRDH